MDNINLKKIIKNHVVTYGISMALAGSSYGEKRQSCTEEEKTLSEKGEKYHSGMAETTYNVIMRLLDELLSTPCKDDNTHGKNVAERNSVDHRSICE